MNSKPGFFKTFVPGAVEIDVAEGVAVANRKVLLGVIDTGVRAEFVVVTTLGVGVNMVEEDVSKLLDCTEEVAKSILEVELAKDAAGDSGVVVSKKTASVVSKILPIDTQIRTIHVVISSCTIVLALEVAKPSFFTASV